MPRPASPCPARSPAAPPAASGPAATAAPARPPSTGPYPTWTRKISGRTVTRTLTPQEAERLRPYFDAHRRLRQLITELEALSIELASQPRPPHEQPRTQPGDQPA